MSDPATNNPTPTSPTPSPTTPPTTPPVETPPVETPPPTETPPAKEPEGKTLVTEPVAEAFDPEKLTLPEGFEKNEHFTQFTDWAKEAGINHPQAEKLMGLYTDAVKQMTESTTRAWEEQNTAWQNEVKADKELGGTNLPVVKQTISKMLDNPDMTDPKFREALDFTGAGNNPAVIRTLYRWAQKLVEGASVAGSPPARDGNGALTNQRPATFGSALYGPEGPHSGGPKLG